MKQTGSAYVVCAAIVAGLSLPLLATSVWAQTPGGAYLNSARCVAVIDRRNGHSSCVQQNGSSGQVHNHAYEQWQDGSPAQTSGSSGEYRFPHYFGGHNALYGFGR